MPRNNQLSLEEALLAQNNVPVNQAFNRVMPNVVRQRHILDEYQVECARLIEHMPVIVREQNFDDIHRLYELEAENERLRAQVRAQQQNVADTVTRGFQAAEAAAPQQRVILLPATDLEGGRGPAFDERPLKQVTGIDD